jgi:hypothetical protein
MSIEHIRAIKAAAGLPKPKKYKPIAKKSAKKLKQEAEEKKLRGDDDTLMEQWFKARRKELTGTCDFCGGKTEKHNNETYKRSIAHLLPKRSNMFPSVATHPANYLELCFYGNSCHTNFDNGIISWELLRDSKEWSLIVTKFKEIYPFINENEKKNIPESLLSCINL